MQFTLLHILHIIILLAAFVAAAAQNSPIAKPRCMDRCGNVSIPFPFGTDKSCYHSQGFWVICNQSVHNSPRLVWPNGSNVEINSISLNGQMRIMMPIAYECPNFNSSKTSIIELPDKNFTFNSTINRFTLIGYYADGYLSGSRSYLSYSTGCGTRSTPEQDLEKGSCRGSGCCQTSIPPDAQSANVTVKMWRGCTYGFLAEENAFEFSNDSLQNIGNIEKLPVVVDWAIGDGTCESAKNISLSDENACVSANSDCYEPDTSKRGYRCRCKDGYDGNPYLIDGCQDINECLLEQKKCHHHCKNSIGGYECRCRRGYRGDGIVGGSGCKRDELLIVKIVTGIFSGIIFSLMTAWLVSIQLTRRQLRKMMKRHFINNGGIRLQQELDKLQGPAAGFAKKRRSASLFKIFEQSEMEEATGHFDENKVLGRGGFGKVYKGTLWDGREVAIKEPKEVDPNQVDNFITEVIVLSQINHRNLVKLVGCCLERKIPLLVYEFISHGDLSSYIHENPKKMPPLDWTKRLNIAIETAGALSYLHFDASNRVIHRDIKPDNILLDHDFTAKVSDFGASRLVPLDETQIATHVIGTRGYLDPEFRNTKKLTTQSDVYSFGAVLLGLLTEKRPIDTQTGENFVVAFLSLMQEQEPSQRESLLFKHVVGHILREENKDQIIKVAELAHRCLNPEGKDRPSMKEVESELKKMVE